MSALRGSPRALLLAIIMSTQLISNVCLGRYLRVYPEELRALRNFDGDSHRLVIRQYFDPLGGMALGKRASDLDRIGSRLQFFDPLGGMALGKRSPPAKFHPDALDGALWNSPFAR
uniref:Uncharacterized protein n=1 Tax=Trichuris muris TaxID=70415 RepID=A0A5S6QL81_TRIMR